MPTPAEHKTIAEAILNNPDLRPSLSLGHLSHVHAHAALSQALGTGVHYEAADDILASLPPAEHGAARALAGERALAHALLADR